jgi:hypothetical protein
MDNEASQWPTYGRQPPQVTCRRGGGGMPPPLVTLDCHCKCGGFRPYRIAIEEDKEITNRLPSDMIVQRGISNSGNWDNRSNKPSPIMLPNDQQKP